MDPSGDRTCGRGWVRGARVSLDANQAMQFTASEVRCRLRQRGDTDPRSVAVHTAASDVSAWTSLLSRRAAFELGRSADRLPTVVYWFTQGRQLEEIGRGLSRFGGTWDGDQAVETASGLIARLLNQRLAAYAPRSARDTAY